MRCQASVGRISTCTAVLWCAQMTRTLTIRLSTEDLDSLEQLARSTKRSKAFLASQAVSEYVTS
jgi:predicted DNA-binding protein